MPVESIPGRMGVLLTLMLCTVNIFNSTAEKFPPNANAITQWILSCLLFIILAILEYTLLLGYKKYSEPEDEENNMTGPNHEVIGIGRLSKRMDKWMLVIFPPSFIVFALVFWLG